MPGTVALLGEWVKEMPGGKTFYMESMEKGHGIVVLQEGWEREVFGSSNSLDFFID